jgi:large subunit ribosomal protein L4
MYRGAVCSILSELARQQRLTIVDDLMVAEPRTKVLAGRLRELGLDDVLILVEAFDEKLHLAARNLPHVDVMTAAEVDPVSMIAFDKLLATEAAIRRLEERLA